MPLIRSQLYVNLHVLAYNLGNFLRTMPTPETIKDLSLTTLKEKLIEIGAKVVSHGRSLAFQMAEVAISRHLCVDILQPIAELRPPLELTEGTVIADSVGETPCVFLAGLHQAKRAIADRLMRLANSTRLPWPWIDPNKALPWVEERIGLALAESQVAAIRLALMSKVVVMTGGDPPSK